MTSSDDRKEPVIPEAVLAVDDDDRVARSGSRSGPDNVRIAGRKKPARSSRRPARRVTPGMLLMVLVVAALAYLLWNASRQQARNDSLLMQLDAATQRINALEGGLSAAGASRNESETQVERKVGTLEHEIRKLWDVSNKRNKQWIQDNQAALEKLTRASAGLEESVGKQVAGFEKSLEQISAERKQQAEAHAELQSGLAELPGLQKALDKVTASTSELKKSIAAMRSETASSRNGIAEQLKTFEQNLLSMQARSDQLGAQVTRLKTALASLEQKHAAAEGSGSDQELAALRQALVENEQAVRSFDAFRRQTNQSITSLQAAVSKLQNNN